MYLFLFYLVLIVVFIVFIRKITRKVKPTHQTHKPAHNQEAAVDNTRYYVSKRSFFTRPEHYFYDELQRQLPESLILFSKTRMEDIIDTNPSLDYKVARNKRKSTRSRHLDFVLIDKKSYKPLAAIELDGKSHNSEKQRASDKIKNSIMEQSEIPFFRIRVGTNFAEEIQKIFIQLQ